MPSFHRHLQTPVEDSLIVRIETLQFATSAAEREQLVSCSFLKVCEYVKNGLIQIISFVRQCPHESGTMPCFGIKYACLKNVIPEQGLEAYTRISCVRYLNFNLKV